MIFYHVISAKPVWAIHMKTVKEEKGISFFPLALLSSYFELRTTSLDKYLGDTLVPEEVRFFLDSGAYGAFTHHERLKVEDYIAWVQRNKHWVHTYANLDVIHDWRQSEYNLKKMQDAGLNPIPVYHRGEPVFVLEKMLAEHAYIALGGIAGKDNPLEALPDIKAYAALSNTSGVDMHLLGVGSFAILRKAKFATADSSTFIQSRYGKIRIFDERSMTAFNVSYRSKEFLKYEHLLSRYGLPTFAVMMQQQRGLVNQYIRAFEYIQSQVMADYINAIWDAREKVNQVA